MNTQTQTQKNLINTSDIKVDDVFSEESHYVFLGPGKSGVDNKGNIINTYQFHHLESKKTITLDEKYVTELLTTADQYDSVVEVGREDKHWTQKQIDDAKKKGEAESETLREGDLKQKGIRSIWSDIHTTKVFSVCFDKKAKEQTKKAFNEAKNKQVQDALALVGSGKASMEDVIKSIQDNPIVSTIKGEERVLRGYKVQFVSNNGVYDVVDMDIEDDGNGSNLRKVNINEIKWLVIDGIRYDVV